MSYTTMNAKFTSVDDVNTEKSVAQITAANRTRNVFLTGFVNWNSATTAGIYTFLDEKGQPLQLPVGSVIRHVYLTQAGYDTSTTVATSACLAGGTFVNVWLTNKNSSGAYATSAEANVITPTQLGSVDTYTATTIGMSSGGTGFVKINGPTANKQVPANTNQATFVCAALTGAATNAKSVLQIAIRAVL